MKLKIAAISDIHGYLPEMIEPADILLLAGDISPIEIQFNKLKMKNWLKTEFAQWIKSLPVEKVFMVAGNHDSYFEGISKANILEMSQACQKLIYLKNETTHFIDKEGQLWSIFGTPYCHIYGNWPFMRSEEYMVEKFKKIPDEVDIIISHDPPFAAGDVDVILDVPVGRLGKVRLHEHLGNQPLKERIENVNYKLLVCGHIHGGEHIFNNEWRTVNVSYLDEAYQPAHSIFYKEIEKMMTEEEIEKGNELLTQFLIPNFPETLNFSRDWHQLMEILEKIEELGYEWSIIDGEVEICAKYITNTIESRNKNQTLLEAAFKCCINFVEQYNTKTLKQSKE